MSAEALFALSLDNLPALNRLATAAKALLLDVDLDLARASTFSVLEVVDRAALVELADALEALRGPR